MNEQYKFLKTVAVIAERRGDGQAHDSEVRKMWPECPKLSLLHYYGEDMYYEKGGDLDDPVYILTGNGKDYIASCEAKKRESIVAIIALAVAVLTLMVACVQLFL